MKFVAAPYQIEIHDFLVAHERAAAFCGIGLGKTASTLSALNTLFLDGEIRAALIVAPLRVANLTWPNEVQKWDQFRWMKVESLRKRKPSGRAHLYTINWESLPKLTDLSFCDVVIYDELTKAANAKSIRVKAHKPYLKHHRRWGLTGTPRPNSLLQLFGQLRLLDDGARLGKSFAQFREAWFVPTDYMRYKWVPREGAEKAVTERIADMTITMRTCDHLNLPEMTVEDVDVTLPDKAREIYRELEKELLVAIGDEGDVVAQTAASLVNKLLQITGGFVYTEDRTPVQVHDAKIKALKALLEEYKDENFLVSVNYIHEREGVCKAIPYATDASKVKGDLESRWNAGEFRCLVADPRSLGHGLNLQAAGRSVAWYSPTYSRELYDQFNGRAFRRGQTKPTQVFRLICSDSIDLAVIESLRVKGEGQSAMMSLLSNLRKLRLTQA